LCGWLLRATRFVAKDALKLLHRRRQKEQELSVNLKIDQGPTFPATTNSF
jgi:hypothetical protein